MSSLIDTAVRKLSEQSLSEQALRQTGRQTLPQADDVKPAHLNFVRIVFLQRYR